MPLCFIVFPTPFSFPLNKVKRKQIGPFAAKRKVPVGGGASHRNLYYGNHSFKAVRKKVKLKETFWYTGIWEITK